MAVATACGDGELTRAQIEAAVETRVAGALERVTDRYDARADSVFQALRPVPLLTPSEEAALRRYLNPEHLDAARRYGVARPQNPAELEELRRQGALVELGDSTEYWIVRDLEYSAALVTPETRAMLVELGERFQERIGELGLPPYRFTINSALRTAEDQAALRRTNPNAAAGVSTHEFGTTVDISYAIYGAPAEPVLEIDEDLPPWLAHHLRRVGAAMLERVAAQKSRELQAIMGDVLREMQAEGRVLVILERQQPIYHLTVAE